MSSKVKCEIHLNLGGISDHTPVGVPLKEVFHMGGFKVSGFL